VNVTCPQNECFVRISINPGKLVKEINEMSGWRTTECVRKTAMNRSTPNLLKSPHDRDNLSGDFSIAMKPVLITAMEIAGIGIDNQGRVFNPTTCR
jgi:hypothetical protein